MEKLFCWNKINVSLYLCMLLFSLAESSGIQTQSLDGFENLSELKEYAKTLDEWIKMDNQNIANPSYETYYERKFSRSLMRSLFSHVESFFMKLHLMRRPYFSLPFFRSILKEVTQERVQRGWKGNFVQKISIKPTSKIVVFGPVQGAFHGLVRYMEQLVKLDIIDENFNVKNPDLYIVFLGNVVNRSPYTLEIFSILLRLLKNNPENVIYLKGPNEFYEYWHEHTLYRELELGFKDFTQCIEEAKYFFNTLPLTLFGKIVSSGDNYIKFEPSIRDEALEKKLSSGFLINPFIQKNSKVGLDILDLDKEAKSAELEVLIKPCAEIKDIRKKYSYQKMNGLRLLNFKNGSPVWTVLSTASESYRVFFDFHFDAFTIIYPAFDLKAWKISLYNRLVVDKDPLFKVQSFNFFNGNESKY